MQETEYKEEDSGRKQIADQLEWLDFETKMQTMVKALVNPALDLHVREAEQRIEMELVFERLQERVDLVEQTLFGKRNKPATVFEAMQSKIMELQKLLKTSALQQAQSIEQFQQTVDHRLFQQDQRILEINSLQIQNEKLHDQTQQLEQRMNAASLS